MHLVNLPSPCSDSLHSPCLVNPPNPCSGNLLNLCSASPHNHSSAPSPPNLSLLNPPNPSSASPLNPCLVNPLNPFLPLHHPFFGSWQSLFASAPHSLPLPNPSSNNPPPPDLLSNPLVCPRSFQSNRTPQPTLSRIQLFRSPLQRRPLIRRGPLQTPSADEHKTLANRHARQSRSIPPGARAGKSLRRSARTCIASKPPFRHKYSRVATRVGAFARHLPFHFGRYESQSDRLSPPPAPAREATAATCWAGGMCRYVGRVERA